MAHDVFDTFATQFGFAYGVTDTDCGGTHSRVFETFKRRFIYPRGPEIERKDAVCVLYHSIPIDEACDACSLRCPFNNDAPVNIICALTRLPDIAYMTEYQMHFLSGSYFESSVIVTQNEVIIPSLTIGHGYAVT